MTTKEENLKGRVEYLENLMKRLFDRLQSGKNVEVNSEAHRDIGITIEEIAPASTEWGCKRCIGCDKLSQEGLCAKCEAKLSMLFKALGKAGAKLELAEIKITED